MNRKTLRTHDVTLSYSVVATAGLSDLRCPACKSFLDIHQPDPIQPERILGTCSECGAWHLIEVLDATEQMIVLQLPTLADLPESAIVAHKT
jgi:hypothetical protein